MRILAPILIANLVALGFAQEPSFTDYLAGSAEVSEATVTFYLQNISGCVVDDVKVRVAHNLVYFTTDETTLFTSLQPGDASTFVMRLSQVASPDWQWTIDGLKLSKPDPVGNCNQEGVLAFEPISFGEGAPQPQASSANPSSLMHTVQAGETLWQIAQRYGVSMETILEANGRSQSELREGEVIRIPGSGSAVIPVGNPEFSLHTIVAGDTLSKIARQYGSSLELIVAANCLDPSAILIVGNQLRVPPITTDPQPLRDACS
jgi:LysM repeat protein